MASRSILTDTSCIKNTRALTTNFFIGGFCLMLGWLLVQTKLCTTNYQRMKNSPGYSCPSNWGIFRKCTYLWQNIHTVHMAEALRRKYGEVNIKLQCIWYLRKNCNLQHKKYVGFKKINIITFCANNLFLKLFS